MATVLLKVDVDRFDFKKVVQAVKDAGLTVEEEQPIIGIIAGRVSDEDRETVASVEGITAIQDEHSFQLPGPDSPIQ